MEKTKKYILFFSGGILLASLLYLAGSRIPSTLGSAPSGLAAGFASSSPIAVTAGTVSTPVATSTGSANCASRIVATASTTAMVIIGEMHPSASKGYFIAASTTKEFDGGIYGCGALKVYPFATGAITVTDNY